MKTGDITEHWIKIAGEAIDTRRRNGRSNAALCVLKDIMGGDDVHVVSRNLTVEMEERWMDDTTILVQKLGCA